MGQLPGESIDKRVECSRWADAQSLRAGSQPLWFQFRVRRSYRREPGSRPTIHFYGKAAGHAERLGMKRAALSITHTEKQAMAQVILED